MPLPIKFFSDVWWFDLFLSNNFSFDSMLLVETSKGGECYSFVGKLPLEEPHPLFQCATCPERECLRTSQESDVVLVQFPRLIDLFRPLWKPDGLSTQVLDSIVVKSQSLRDLCIGGKLRG